MYVTCFIDLYVPCCGKMVLLTYMWLLKVLLMCMFLVMVNAADGMIVSCHSKRVLLMCMFLVMVTAPLLS